MELMFRGSLWRLLSEQMAGGEGGKWEEEEE
jgi:hypothetical protein